MRIIYEAIRGLLNIIEIAILIRVLLSWFRLPGNNPLIALLYQITEPILAPIRSIIERSAIGKNMMLDFSPIIAFLLIGVVKNMIP